MPEGDTAYRAAHHLARTLADRAVTGFSLRVPSVATIDLTGETIRGSHARGKHILIEIGDWTVHSHLGMDGAWLLKPPRRPSGPTTRTRRSRGSVERWPAEFRIRARIDTDEVVALGVDLARLDCWPTNEEADRFAWLGPDLLVPECDLDEAARRILAEPDRPITAALLDQRNVAGLGNEYVTEMCFLRGVHPHRTVAEAGDIDAWLHLGRRLMLANRDRVERTFTGNRMTGQSTYVFSRGGEPCRRCGTTVVAGAHASGVRRDGGPDGVVAGGERVAAWCPNCQR